MAAPKQPTCENEINFLVDLDEEDLPENILEGLPENIRENILRGLPKNNPEGLPEYDPEAVVKRVKRKRSVALKALTEWTEQVKVVEGKLSRRTKRVDSSANEIYQLVGLYSVFVGVVFTAVQADRVQCQHVWSPIVLCLLPCLIIARIIDKKIEDIRRIRDDIDLDEKTRRVHLNNLGKLKATGYLRFEFGKDAPEHVLTPKKHHESVTKIGVLLTLLISSAVTVGSFLHILCFTKSHSCEGSVNWNDYASGRILPY